MVPPLLDVWQALEKAKRLEEAAELHRGIEWKQFDEDICYSATEKPGYRRGFTRINNNLVAFLPLPVEYLDVEPSRLRRAANLPWDKPKVVLNAARISRGPWRLAAFVDLQGNLCSQRFIGMWPLTSAVTVECIAAILNGPVANAFISSFEPRP